MKKILCIFSLIVILPCITPALAQDTNRVNSNKVKTSQDSFKKQQTTGTSANADTTSKSQKDNKETGGEKKRPPLDPVTSIVVVACFFIVMILLLIYFFDHLKTNRQRIGFQSIKFIGLTLIFPGICILAIVGGSEVLSGQTLAVLLGTIAGYVLSRDDESKDNSREFNKIRDDFAKKEKDFTETIKKLEEQMKNIRTKNPSLIE